MNFLSPGCPLVTRRLEPVQYMSTLESTVGYGDESPQTVLGKFTMSTVGYGDESPQTVLGKFTVSTSGYGDESPQTVLGKTHEPWARSL